MACDGKVRMDGRCQAREEAAKAAPIRSQGLPVEKRNATLGLMTVELRDALTPAPIGRRLERFGLKPGERRDRRVGLRQPIEPSNGLRNRLFDHGTAVPRYRGVS